MPREWQRFSLAWLIVVLLALPRLTSADIIQDYMDSLSGSGTTDTTSSSSGTTGTGTTTTTDPYKDFLQFDPYKNNSGLTSVAALTYLSGADDPISITYRFINIALSFLGLISTIMVMYAGAVWFFSRDNEEKVTQAKQILFGAVIGLGITLGSLSLSVYLFSLTSAVTGNV